MEISLAPEVVSMIASVVIPIVTGLVTKLRSSNGEKAVVALFLSAVVGGLSQIVTKDGSFVLEQVLYTSGVSFVTQLASYLGVWKPIGKDRLVPLQGRTANFGLARKEARPNV